MAEASLYSSGQRKERKKAGRKERKKEHRIWGQIETMASSLVMVSLCSSAFCVFNGIRQSKWPRKIELSNSESTRLVISVFTA